MELNPLTSRQSIIIGGLNDGKVAWDYSCNLPKTHRRGLNIPYSIKTSFPENFIPIILKGSRDRMCSGYISPDREMRMRLSKRILRKFKFTKFVDDNLTKDQEIFISKVNEKISKSYPSSRYLVGYKDFQYRDYVLGKSLYLSFHQREYIKKLIKISNKLGDQE